MRQRNLKDKHDRTNSHQCFIKYGHNRPFNLESGINYLDNTHQHGECSKLVVLQPKVEWFSKHVELIKNETK